MRWKFLAIVICLLPFAVESRGAQPGAAAPKPLYRDPVYDGAADPVVIWNPQVEKWWMFYTNRRANVPDLPGVSWVHGTPIGIAESADGGVTWKYVGDAKIESPDPAIAEPTWWAPDVIRGDDGQWHMFLTVVPGVFTDWNHPRNIVHYTSSDLRNWTNPRPLKLANEKVIDATVFKRPDGTWRMFYNNERDDKSIYYADSADLDDVDRPRQGRGRRRPLRGPEGLSLARQVLDGRRPVARPGRVSLRRCRNVGGPAGQLAAVAGSGQRGPGARPTRRRGGEQRPGVPVLLHAPRPPRRRTRKSDGTEHAAARSKSSSSK